MVGSECSHDSYSLKIMYLKNGFLKKPTPSPKFRSISCNHLKEIRGQTINDLLSSC